MTEGLKPCPFCGSEKIGIRFLRGAGEDLIAHFVMCEDCNGSMMSYVSTDINKAYIHEAKARWNRRASE